MADPVTPPAPIVTPPPATPPGDPPATPPATPPVVTPPPATPPGAPPIEGAPESYADFKFSENVTVNKETLGKFTSLAKDLNIPQAKAQELMDLASGQAAGVAEAQKEAWDKTRDGWVSELKADVDFGGEKFNNTIDHAKRVLKEHGSPELISFLDDTGYGDNPHLIRMLAKIDMATSEDKFIEGQPRKSDSRTAAEVIYPTK